MVARAVYNIQRSVFRSSAKPEVRKFSSGAWSQVGFLLAFLGAEHWILNTALAKDLGTFGTLYPIEEVDPLQIILQKLKGMEESGELKQRNLELQKKAQASIERPKPVEDITRATTSRTFTYDPTYIVKEDLYDHQGRIFAKKGTKINPLENISLAHDLVFFNGDDEEQLAWVKNQLSKNTEIKPIKLILVKGTPLKLAEELKTHVYFDQGGILTKKLGIQHVPTVVSQEGLQLKIEEIDLPPSQELKVEEVR
jgi:conjugal transfer pilus assembly protein TraW